MFVGSREALNREYEKGWVIADGQNGTYDMLNHFPKFGHFGEIGTKGGESTIRPSGYVLGHTLSESEMPVHRHRVAGRSGGNTGVTTNDGLANDIWTETAGGSQSHAHGFIGITHTNEPQYINVLPLQYIGRKAV
ncbi:hypothetical Protein YC6258_03769 [Gynuella sunshinyii YC6258]|uniref:Microcystin-dependent protein n=2 Tax=Gynuella sunshinyii TaxID=1445505 RepID=A0A0C5V8X6_9GAMM|nr:hypothetical Protein YC6258_00196 [Gynuella sunshinyii YC6258]AJQ95805.1 hypothetical Protein YC6258_03769 [Gynuella sunshinyii YC6258]